MSTLSRMQQVALAGSVGAAIAAAAVLGAAGSTATPVAGSHPSAGSHWYGAAGGSSTWLPRAGADTSSSGSSAASTPSSTSTPTSTAASTSTPPASSSTTSSSTTTSTNPNDPVSSGPGDEPENVDVAAVPGPCTQDDIAASRWSTKLTFTNPQDAGTLDYIALAINYNDDSENIDDYPHAGPVSLAAGETGSIVLTGPSDYFPDSLLVGGGVSADGQTAQTAGGIDLYDQADFLKAAKVCGNTTPTPDPIDGGSGYPGDPSGGTETKTRTSTVTVTVTETRTAPAERPGFGEPPTPSPITTRLGVTG